jgi:hypothetical protein
MSRNWWRFLFLPSPLAGAEHYPQLARALFERVLVVGFR